MSTQDEINLDEIGHLDDLCGRVMRQLESVFGVAERKFCIHLVSHIPFATRLYGPLQNVSCYGPEDQIGKISRRVLSMNNTAKHIMNSSILLQLATMKLQDKPADLRSSHDSRMVCLANRILGRRNGGLSFKQCNERYRPIGKPSLGTPSDSVIDAAKGYISCFPGNEALFFGRLRLKT